MTYNKTMTRLAPKFTVVRRILSLSGNLCAFPKCENLLVFEDTFVGELAHIYAAEAGGPRYNPDMDDDQRRDFPNLMYLCGYHHTIIDKKDLIEKYPADWLISVKADHEAENSNRLYDPSDSVLEQALEEINIVQANVLMNGNQTNIQQNFFNDAAVNASKALSQVLANTNDDSKQMEDADAETASEDSEGFLDRMAGAEVTIPLWNKTIEDMTAEINKVTPIFNSGVESLKHSDKMKKGLSGRRHELKKIASQLDPIAIKIEALGSSYADQFKVVDSGINAILDTAEIDQDKANELEDFFGIMLGVVDSSIEGLSQVEGMLEQMEVLEKMSTDMRRTLLKLRNGLAPMSSSKTRIAEWASRIGRFTA